MSSYKNTPPFNNELILDYYKGYYSSVYIIFHPFYRVKTEGTIDYKTEYPSKNQILNLCEIVSWQEFLKLSDIKDISTLDIALRNSIGGLIKKYANDLALKKLNEISEKYKIYQPNEGFLEDSLINSMMTTLQFMGYKEVYIGDEFGEEKELSTIAEIIKDKDGIDLQKKTIYTLDNSILFSVHWDSHFTLLCSSKENIEKIQSEFNFEGFYCNEQTRVYWSLD